MESLLLQFTTSNVSFHYAGFGFGLATIGQLIIGVFCAIGVANACQKMEVQNREPLFVPRLVWIIGSFFTGFVGLLIFWLMHESTLSRKTEL